MRIVITEIKATEQAAIGRERQFLRKQPIAGIGHKKQGIYLLLVALGIDKPVVGCAFIHRHIGTAAHLIEPLEIGLQPRTGIRELELVISLTVGLEVRASHRPLHAVGTYGSVTDHGHTGSPLTRLKIIAQLQGTGKVVTQCDFGTEGQIIIRMGQLTIMQITCSDTSRITDILP